MSRPPFHSPSLPLAIATAASLGDATSCRTGLNRHPSAEKRRSIQNCWRRASNGKTHDKRGEPVYPPLAELQPPRAMMLRLSSAQKLFAPSAIVRLG